MSWFFGLMIKEGVQLESIKMARLRILSKATDDHVICCENMIRFLKMQTKLATVDFTNGDNNTSPCLEILESLVAETVQQLLLQNYFYFPAEIINPVNSGRFLSAIIRFHGLRTLALNYRYITNHVMSDLADCLVGQLELFDILFMKNSSLEAVDHISNDSWKLLKAKCPRMLVHFKMEIDRIRTDDFIADGYLSPEIPLEKFQYKLKPIWMEQFDHTLFDFLTNNFSSTLRDVVFQMTGHKCADICRGITDMVTNCRLIESLAIRVRFRNFTIEELLKNVLTALEQLDGDDSLFSVFKLYCNQPKRLDCQKWKCGIADFHQMVPQVRSD